MARTIRGQRFRFDYPEVFTTLPDYTAHAGQSVKVLRRMRSPEEYDYEGDAMYEVEAADGWRGHAWRSELVTP